MPTKKAPEMVIEEAANVKEQNALFEAARKVLLAGVGAIVLAQEEIEDFVHRLIERGEIAEQDGRKLLREVMDRQKKEADQTTQKAESEVTKRLDSVKQWINLPSKAEINALTEKIAELSKQIDELKKA